MAATSPASSTTRWLERSATVPVRSRWAPAWLAQSAVKTEALADLAQLDEVVAFKQRFYPSAWARYELAVPGSLRLVPPAFRLPELERDFAAMQAMIFDKPLSMPNVIEILTGLEQEINAPKGKS